MQVSIYWFLANQPDYAKLVVISSDVAATDLYYVNYSKIIQILLKLVYALALDPQHKLETTKYCTKMIAK